MELENLFNIEKKYNLFELHIQDYYYWAYVRGIISSDIETSVKHLSPNGTRLIGVKNSLFKDLKNNFVRMRNIITHGRIPKRNYSVLFYAHPRRILENGKYISIYTDDIEKCYSNSITLEDAYNKIHYSPAVSNNLVYIDILDYECFFYSFFNSLIKKNEKKIIERKITEALTPVFEQLNDLYGVSLSVPKYMGAIVYGYYMYKCEKKYFNRILNRVQPKAIVEVVSYSRRCMVLNEVALIKGIPTIELQHGVIDKEHAGYNYPYEFRLPQFPQNIFLFSEYWKNKANFPIQRKNIFSVGFPYLERKTQASKGTQNKSVVTILVLSQAPIGDKLSRIILKLSQKLNSNQFHIIYKLHPFEYANWHELYPYLENSSIDVIDDNNRNLYDVFSEADIQVSGYNSTTVFEGLSFGLPTFIFDYSACGEFKELRDNNVVQFFHNELELLTLINSSVKPETKSSSTKLWENDSLNKMKKELDLIISNKDK